MSPASAKLNKEDTSSDQLHPQSPTNTAARKRTNLRSKCQQGNHEEGSSEKRKPRKPLSHGARIRKGIVAHTKQEERDQQRIARMNRESHNSMQKLYLALIMNAILVLLGITLYFRPEIFFSASRRDKDNAIMEWPPHHLAALLPVGVSLQHDLPRFFQQYSIATDQNLEARRAVRRLLKLRSNLKFYQIFINAWDRNTIFEHSIDKHCGKGFQLLHDHTTQLGNTRHAEDLLLWCLLHTYQNDGLLHWNATLDRAPLQTTQALYRPSDTLRGIIPQYYSQYENRVHPSFLWLPKKRHIQVDTDTDTNTKTNKTTYDMDTQVPELMLSWLLQSAPSYQVWEYVPAMEEHLYRLIQDEKDKWMTLDVVCDDIDGVDGTNKIPEKLQSRRIMGRDCLPGQTCCTIYLPVDTIASNRTRRYVRSSSSDSRD